MTTQLTDQEVRIRAYELWEARGRPQGSAEEDWLAARQQLELETAKEAGAMPLDPLAADAADALEPGVLEPEPAPPPPPTRPGRRARGGAAGASRPG
jgi:hypothetical protein